MYNRKVRINFKQNKKPEIQEISSKAQPMVSEVALNGFREKISP
jgi:hypothetical protein